MNLKVQTSIVCKRMWSKQAPADPDHQISLKRDIYIYIIYIIVALRCGSTALPQDFLFEIRKLGQIDVHVSLRVGLHSAKGLSLLTCGLLDRTDEGIYSSQSLVVHLTEPLGSTPLQQSMTVSLQ